MSGPKVVRVVTREEVLDICRGLLARVDRALAEWNRVGRRNESIDDEAIAAASARRERLAKLIATDRFLDLQKQAPQEEAFLRNDIQARLTAIAEQELKARSGRRREVEAAASLLRQLRDAGKLDAELEGALSRGESSAISKGFRVLADEAAPQARATGFAAGLRDEQSVATFAEWLARQPPETTDPAIERIERRLGELKAFNDDHDADWQARLMEARDAPAARRQLLLDGLEVDTGRALTTIRRQAALVFDLRLVLAELDAVGGTPSPIHDDPTGIDIEALEARLDDARAKLVSHRAERATASRQAAVLRGLAQLGYEVTGGMSTSLPEDGRLVVKSATRPDYGVEVSAAPGGERLQMRVVAFDSGSGSPDLGRDRDAETIWCSDVSSLQASLAAAGSNLVIERAMPIGATPLKRISITSDQAQATVTPARKEQKLQ